MKLIRLITNDPDAVFDNTFNEDILLKSNSKLALQSIAVDTENNVIEIDSSNDEITFQITTGFTQSFRLTHALYTQLNYEDFLTDLQNNLNNRTGFTQGTFENRRNLGLEWKVEIDSDKKSSIGYKIGQFAEFPTSWDYDAGKVERVQQLGKQVWRQLGIMPNNAQNNRSMIFPTYTSTGCGFIRCRTNKYENNLGLSNNQNGYIIGLSTVNISEKTPDTLTNADLTFGIAVSCTTTNVRRYFKVLNGIYSNIPGNPPPNFIGVGDNNNDYQEVILNFGAIDFNVYQNGSAIPLRLHQEQYTAGQKLYPFVVFRGGNVNLNLLKTIPSPYSSFAPPPLEEEEEVELFAPPRPQRNPSENVLTLNPSISEFLGFNHPRIPQVGEIIAPEYDFVSESPFEPSEISDAFLIELLNLKCESYDGLKNQRKNILAVVPKSNKDGEIIYETNTPFFIDLNNLNDILLRNIRLRVVRPDYSPLRILGQASIVLLVDG